jgi:hypothetical protein
MAFQYSATVRNAFLDAVESAIGTAPTLEIRSGAVPSNCAAADNGTQLVAITLPSDWLAGASAGAKSLSGTWSGTGVAAGTAGHFRVKVSGTTHIQGTITATGAGGDMTVDNSSVAIGQTFAVSSFSLSANGA